ncbi:hypothetical protein FKM82_031342 [Ascaphus truei]
MASADLREELTCPICLSIYTQPVTLRCGHNFCQGCIGSVLDNQKGSGVYTCPDCSTRFQGRPALQRNMKLCNILEHFLSAQPKAVTFCTYCVDAPEPAAKTCLQCEASLCDIHLTIHNKSVEHVLTDPTTSLESRKCPIHKEPLKYYCSEDAAYICASCCVVGEHRGHQVELLNEASVKKKEKLRTFLEKLTSKREKIEKRVQNLHEQKRKGQKKSAGETDRVTALFRDIREQLEVLEKRVLSEITRQEEQVSLRVSDLIQQLEIKRDELSTEMLHIEELFNVTDPVTVLKGWESDNAAPTRRNDKTVPIAMHLDEVLISLTLQRSLHRLSDILPDLKAQRGFYVQEASGLLLDANTASENIVVSDDLKTASDSNRNQQRPDEPEKFRICQVLSTRSFFSGQYYWEVETSESGNWRVGVSYPTVKRNGLCDHIGSNDKSWCLWRWGKYSSVKHDLKQTTLCLDPSTHRFGIYLDYDAGRLSFYQLCDPIRHLHTFTATFTEPLHAAFYVYMNGWVRIRT